jgi:hypothetical protein
LIYTFFIYAHFFQERNLGVKQGLAALCKYLPPRPRKYNWGIGGVSNWVPPEYKSELLSEKLGQVTQLQL